MGNEIDKVKLESNWNSRNEIVIYQYENKENEIRNVKKPSILEQGK
jgi:hypothetical protein